MTHAEGQLLDLALGALTAADQAEVEAHVASCAHCRVELEAVRDLAASIAAAQPVAPPPSLRARVLASAAAPGRFAFLDLLARVLDLGPEGVSRVLDAAREAASWVPAGIPGVELLHFQAGPQLAGADTGLVRFAPGTRFPRHTHLGPETMIVLEGGYTEEGGAWYGPGSRAENGAGSSHAFTCDPVEGCLAAVVLHGGVNVEGYGAITVR